MLERGWVSEYDSPGGHSPATNENRRSAMAEEKLDLVGCGSMVVDLFYRTPRIIRADEKILLRAHTASAAIERTQVGGLVLNHLGWGRILGLKTGCSARWATTATASSCATGWIASAFGII